MPADIQALFESTRRRWPHTLTVPDRLAREQGGLQTELLAIYREIEDALPIADDLAHVSAWALHQALWEIGAETEAIGIGRLRAEDVPFDLFALKVRANLADESWKNIRGQVVGLDP